MSDLTPLFPQATSASAYDRVREKPLDSPEIRFAQTSEFANTAISAQKVPLAAEAFRLFCETVFKSWRAIQSESPMYTAKSTELEFSSASDYQGTEALAAAWKTILQTDAARFVPHTVGSVLMLLLASWSAPEANAFTRLAHMQNELQALDDALQNLWSKSLGSPNQASTVIHKIADLARPLFLATHQESVTQTAQVWTQAYRAQPNSDLHVMLGQTGETGGKRATPEDPWVLCLVPPGWGPHHALEFLIESGAGRPDKEDKICFKVVSRAHQKLQMTNGLTLSLGIATRLTWQTEIVALDHLKTLTAPATLSASNLSNAPISSVALDTGTPRTDANFALSSVASTGSKTGVSHAGQTTGLNNRINSEDNHSASNPSLVPPRTALALYDAAPQRQADGTWAYHIDRRRFPQTDDHNRRWAPLIASWAALMHCESIPSSDQFGQATTLMHRERAVACATDALAYLGPQSSEGSLLLVGDKWVSLSGLLSELGWSAADVLNDQVFNTVSAASTTHWVRTAMLKTLGEEAAMSVFGEAIAHCAGVTKDSVSVSVESTDLRARLPNDGNLRCYLWFAAEQNAAGGSALIAYSAVARPDYRPSFGTAAAVETHSDIKLLRWEMAVDIGGDISHQTAVSEKISLCQKEWFCPEEPLPMMVAVVSAKHFSGALSEGVKAVLPSASAWLAAHQQSGAGTLLNRP